MRFPVGRAIAAAFLLAISTTVLAQQTPAMWNGFTAVTLTFAEGGSPGTTWSGVFDESTRDFLLDVQLREPDLVRGKVGLVGGRAMIVQGLTLARGAEIDAMDGPILSMRLALTLLERLFPDGPSSIVGLKDVSYKGDVAIRFATPSASGQIPAPWSATGKVENYNKGVVNFDLALMLPATNPAARSPTGQMRLKGRLASRTLPVFRDDMPLAGWGIFMLGPVRRPEGGVSVGATPEPNAGVKTIGELKASLAQMRPR